MSPLWPYRVEVIDPSVSPVERVFFSVRERHQGWMDDILQELFPSVRPNSEFGADHLEAALEIPLMWRESMLSRLWRYSFQERYGAWLVIMECPAINNIPVGVIPGFNRIAAMVHGRLPNPAAQENIIPILLMDPEHAGAWHLENENATRAYPSRPTEILDQAREVGLITVIALDDDFRTRVRHVLSAVRDGQDPRNSDWCV